VGDAGVGKSRLLYEFLHQIEAEGGLELESTCVSYGSSMAYRPIVELLRRYLGLPRGSSSEGIRSHVAEQLQFLGLEGEERCILLAHFLGVSAPLEFLNRFTSAQLKARLLDVLRDVFLGASELAPLILIVENMHWIDSASEEFLAHLAASLPGHRVLLVLTTRPGYAASWLAAPLAETITLEGLGAGDVRGMVRTLLAAQEVAEPLFEILADKSEGNPLYVEEILRQLQETGGIAVENGEAQLSRADVTVPATIHDIIAARIDRIAEPLKQTLQGAAVVGRLFSISLVSRILQVVSDQVAGHLRDLHALDFVFPSAQDPELMYSFKHALTQDVVYESVLERRRRQYHAAAGFGLEELYAGRTNEMVEFLAYHFGRSPEDEKAVDYTLRAADKAQQRWANTATLSHLEVALKRLDTMPDTTPNRLRRIDAVLKQGEVKFALGSHVEHIESLEGIRTLVDENADPRRRATWYYWMGFLHSFTRSWPEVAIAYCREAVSTADGVGFEDIRAFADSCLAQVHYCAGNLWEAVATGERALATFEASGNVWWACRTLWHLITAASALGEWSRGLEYCHRALEHGLTVDDLRLKVVGWYRTGSTHIQQGDIVSGLQCCEAALALAPIPFDAAMIQAVQGRGLANVGQAERGTAELAAAVAWFEKSRLHYTRVWFATWLGDVYLQQGKLSQARVLFEEILRTSREAGYRHLSGVAERGLGESLVAEDPAAAAAHLEVALQVLEAIGARNEVAKALVAQAQLHRALGDTAGARTLLARALALFETLGTLDEPRRVQAILATLDDSR
jgi:tetratricopeptide (TPR) repeat protein